VRSFRTALSAAIALALLFATVSARAQVEIRSFSGVIEGHSVGGVTIDLVGNIYVADFGDFVWKITPEGERQVFASGLYGASGNAIDNEGSLLQSNYYGNSIVKIDRTGRTQSFVTSGLSGPVGIAVDGQTREVYVANCRGNSIGKTATDGTVSSFAKSDLFSCPNGISFDRERNLYAVNFCDNKMLKINSHGLVTPFATISAKGLGHLCFGKDRFYVTAFQSHEIYGARRRSCLSPTESLVIRGRDGSISTSMSTTQPLHCRAGQSFAK